MLNRVFGAPNRDQQEWLLLTSACLVKLVAGQTVSWPVFANSMRAAFQLNQSQLDLAMALQYSGARLMFVSGLVFDRWGPRANFTLGVIASTLASLAVTLAFAFPTPFRAHPWALCLLLFIYGHSFNYAEIAVTTAVIARFRSDRRARVMATLENSFSLGAPLTALVHYLLFGNIARSPERETAVGAMAVQTLLTLVVHAIALAIVPQLTTSVAAIVVELGERTPIMQHQQLQQEATEEVDAEFQTRDEDLMEAADEPLQSSWERRETAADFLRATWSGCVNPVFVLLLCGFALAMAQSIAVWLNITFVTRSLGLSSAGVAFFWLPTLLAVPCRGVVGPLSDRYLPEAHQRAAVLLASVAGLGIPALLLVTLPNATTSVLSLTLTSYTLSGLLAAVLFTLTPVLLSQIFSPCLLARLLSACFLAGTLLSAPLTVQSGVLYDLRLLGPGGPTTAAPIGTGNDTAGATCEGQGCRTRGNIANSACILASTACFAALTALLWWRARRGLSYMQ